MTTNTVNASLRDTLLAEAASIGIAARADKATFEGQGDALKNQRGDLTKLTKLHKRQGSGYATPRYTGLTKVASLFARAGFNNPDSEAAREFAMGLVTSFNASFTGKTDKSAKGGNDAAFSLVVRQGDDAAKILAAMQNRLNHHWQAEDDAETIEDAAARRDAVLAARRFTIVADSPDTKTGKPAKYLGRPGATLGDIVVEPGKGTTRDALLRYLCNLYSQHGEAALHPSVVDAVLDNGGLAEKPAPTMQEVARTALAAVNALLVEHGGEASGDALSLKALTATLDRIASEGWKAARGAAPTQDSDSAKESSKAPANAAPPPLPVAHVAPAAPVVPPPLPTLADTKADADTAAALAALLGDGEAATPTLTPPPLPVVPPPLPVENAKPATPSKPQRKLATPTTGKARKAGLTA